MAARQPAPSSASAAPAAGLSMKEYLKRYQSGPAADGDQKKAKKKTKKKPKPAAAGGGGVLIVDEDPVWQKPVQVEDDEAASSGEDRPLVDEDIEVKRMRRLEAIRAARPYNAIAEDGSGWVTVAAREEQGGGGSPRRCRNDTPSPERGGAGRKDLSPPRRRQRHDTPLPEPGGAAGKDTSPPRQRQRRQDTPSPNGNGAADQDDMSPPRKCRRQEDSSPPRRRARNDSEEPQDLELPRRRVRHDSEEPKDMSPPRRHTRHDSEEPKDMSPPRRRTRHDSEEPKDMSPPRRHTRHDSEEPKDFSPPRRRSRHDSEVPKDMSPPRRRKHDDLSPPRRRNLGRSPKDGDISPSKGRKVASDDLSPIRKERDLSPPRKGKKEGAPKQVRKAGLMTAEEVKEDIRKIKEEEMLKFASQDPSLVGKGAKAVFRDKEGKRISEEEMRKAKESDKPKEIHIEWGTGLAQKREAEARLKELEAEKSKPFARTRDDPELDAMLKNRLRWGDPMAHLVKKDPEFLLEDLGDDEKMKESGFIVPQNIPSHSWLKRGVDPPPNRYGIKPGRHWDGVDRSNGFEKDMFKLKNEKQATEQEAYLWSVSDM
ncbi:unnamed protein product [Urochloa humidicola]